MNYAVIIDLICEICIYLNTYSDSSMLFLVLLLKTS